MAVAETEEDQEKSFFGEGLTRGLSLGANGAADERSRRRE